MLLVLVLLLLLLVQLLIHRAPDALLKSRSYNNAT